VSQATYYSALGLDHDDGAAAVRSAYRDLSLLYHPRRIGPGGHANFREIEGAFRVLSDSSLRRRYDEARSRGAEHGLPKERNTPAIAAPPVTSLRSAFPQLREGDAISARFARNFNGLGVPKSEATRVLRLRFVLSPRDVATGLTIHLGLPVLVRCDGCAGRGASVRLQCAACVGEGLLASERVVEVVVAPGGGVPRGLSLAAIGIHNLCLEAVVMVDPTLN
jgi:DnaJ-class molecular chaperone